MVAEKCHGSVSLICQMAYDVAILYDNLVYPMLFQSLSSHHKDYPDLHDTLDAVDIRLDKRFSDTQGAAYGPNFQKDSSKV